MRLRDQDHLGQHDKILSLLKNTKISWVCWHMPVVPATHEVEAGESPEPGKWRLQSVEIILAWQQSKTLFQKNKKEKRKKERKKEKYLVKVETRSLISLINTFLKLNL